jgi:hypothetical protein
MDVVQLVGGGIKLCLPRCPLLPSLCCIGAKALIFFSFLSFVPHKLVVKQACCLHALVGFHLISLNNAKIMQL